MPYLPLLCCCYFNIDICLYFIGDTFLSVQGFKACIHCRHLSALHCRKQVLLSANPVRGAHAYVMNAFLQQPLSLWRWCRCKLGVFFFVYVSRCALDNSTWTLPLRFAMTGAHIRLLPLHVEINKSAEATKVHLPANSMHGLHSGYLRGNGTGFLREPKRAR